MKRDDANPILTRRDIPDIPPLVVDITSVFNPGAVRFDGHDFLLLRVQTRGRETILMAARRDDSGTIEIRPQVVEIEGLEEVEEKIFHIYDPRLTKIGDTVFVVFAADTERGCRLGIARTRDFIRFELVGFSPRDEVRNGVLFPEQMGGRYLRLERPNHPARAGDPPCGSEIVLAESDDLLEWRRVESVMMGRPHFWDEWIGSGPPPVKTREGWLHIYHGVATHFNSSNIYQAGVVLLDLDDPGRVAARSRNNILEPREMYEMVGQVPNVVFPTGMIVEMIDDGGFACPESPVRLYYGAADTSVCLVHSTIQELLQHCRD